MREILFRGKRIDSGEWLEGFYIYDDRPLTGHYIINYKGYAENIFEVIPETVGQFTGLTDKSGNKIFEGDILRAADYPKDTLTFSINWYEYGGFNTLGVNPSAFKILGNIHDNPEFLEDKQ